jgi:acyl carrier protein
MIEKLLKIAEEVLKVPVTEETSIANCEKWDSLNHLILISALEEAFDVSFEPEEIAEMKSIAEIEKRVKK